MDDQQAFRRMTPEQIAAIRAEHFICPLETCTFEHQHCRCFNLWPYPTIQLCDALDAERERANKQEKRGDKWLHRYAAVMAKQALIDGRADKAEDELADSRNAREDYDFTGYDLPPLASMVTDDAEVARLKANLVFVLSDVARLREALTFYADKTTYSPLRLSTPATIDKGDRARAALAPDEGEG